MATADKVLAILGLFTLDRPEWTVEAIAAELQLSSSTAYQYVGSLVGAGLLVAARSGRYTVGPAVIELDRVARYVDPLTRHACDILRDLVRASDEPAMGLVCRLYRLHVMCVDQYAPRPPAIETSYERGRPMPLTRGAHSKVILANLPGRALRRFHERETGAIAAAGLSGDWASFRDEMKAIRRGGGLVNVGELDSGAMGIAAPVFGDAETVIGSVGLVLGAAGLRGDAERIEALRERVEGAGAAITAALSAS